MSQEFGEQLVFHLQDFIVTSFRAGKLWEERDMYIYIYIRRHLLFDTKAQ